jgi:hypothetical protein
MLATCNTRLVGFDSTCPGTYFTGMLQRPCRLEVSRFAHNQALHYLARASKYRLSNLLRQQLTKVVEGFFGSCDEDAARRGIEWMREQARRKGERVTF